MQQDRYTTMSGHHHRKISICMPKEGNYVMNHTTSILVIVLTFTLMSAGIFFAGCTTVQQHQITSATDVAELAPEGYSMISYADISTITSTPVLAAGFGEEMFYAIPALNQTDIKKISAMGWYALSGTSQYEMATVIEGELDSQKIIQSLAEAGYTEETYDGHSIFVGIKARDYVTIQDSFVITGTEDAVKGTIDVIVHGKENAYETDSNLSALLEVLPQGFLTIAMTGNAISFLDMDGMATDMSLSDDDTVQGTVIIMVHDETLLSELNEDLSLHYDTVLSSMPPVFENADITISDNMVQFSGTIPAETLFSDDTYTSLFS